MSQEKRLAAFLYLGFYLTFVTWYHLPRQVSLRAGDLESWPFANLELWGRLLSPFWNRPCLYVLCLAALTGFLWSLVPQSHLTLPGLTALLAVKLGLVAADMRLLSPTHTAHLILTILFLTSRLNGVRLGLIVLALGAAVEGSPWPFVAACLWFVPRTRRLGITLYLALQFGFWFWRGLTAPISPASFEDSGFLLILGALTLIPIQPLTARGWPFAAVLALLALAPLSADPLTRERRWLNFWEPETPRRVLARYTFEHEDQRCVVTAAMAAPATWTDQPSVRVQAEFYEKGALVREVGRLTRPIEQNGSRVLAPGRFELASPETMLHPAFHLAYPDARVELYVDGRTVLDQPARTLYRRWGGNPYLLPPEKPLAP